MLKRRALPILLLAIGLWLLAGCFYLPLPEHPADRTVKDFRKALGDANSKRPLRKGIATRDQVIALLGEPPYATNDARSIAYLMKTELGAWVYPLCFEVEADRARLHAVRIDFDERGMLESWEFAQGKPEEYEAWDHSIQLMPNALVAKLQRPDRMLVPTTKPSRR